MQFSRKRLDEIHARQKSLTKRPQRFDRTEDRTIPQTLPWNVTFEDATRQVGGGSASRNPVLSSLAACHAPGIVDIATPGDHGHCGGNKR